MPTLKYKVSKTIKRRDLDDSTIFRALQEKLEADGPVWDGCFGQRTVKTWICKDGSLGIRNLDNFIWFIGRGWRDVTARVSLKRMEDKTVITVNVIQGWSLVYALVCLLALPLLCVGVALWAGATGWALLLAKGKLTNALQKKLDELGEELE